MKKALVRKDNDKVDRVIDSVESQKLMASTPYQQTYIEVDISDALASQPIEELKSNLVPASAEYWSDGTTQYNAIVNVPTITDANGNIIPDPSFIHYPEVFEHYEIILDSVKVLQSQISQLKSTAKSEIYNELQTRFGSMDPANVNANFTTWKEMLVDSALFAGTFATHDAKDISGNIVVAKGAELIDGPMVLTYATELVRSSKDYLVWRVQRYKTLTDAIALL